MTLDPDLAALEHASERFADAVRTIDLGDWQRPTPCEEWDVQALVDHVVGGNWFTTLILGGHAADEAMQQTMARFGDGSADVAKPSSRRSSSGRPSGNLTHSSRRGTTSQANSPGARSSGCGCTTSSPTPGISRRHWVAMPAFRRHWSAGDSTNWHGRTH
ncbi:MAG: maleylpyruvate isomerase N-terminal domain-containing protein [Acidimicrobiales bacterium]